MPMRIHSLQASLVSFLSLFLSSIHIIVHPGLLLQGGLKLAAMQSLHFSEPSANLQ
jgi:hypothetical protein